jgi:hypothetical protein
MKTKDPRCKFSILEITSFMNSKKHSLLNGKFCLLK